MKLTSEELQTMRTYDTDSSEWSSSHSFEKYWGEEMDRFIGLLPTGRVLEIGSGGGRDAKALVAHGYEYIGIDISQGMVDAATKDYPGIPFIRQSVYDLDFPDDTFDGFWSSAVLIHLPRERIDKALERIHCVLNDGIGMISVKQGEGEGMEEEEPDMPDKRLRLFTYWQDEDFQEVLKRNGFDVIETRVKPKSARSTWLVYFVKVRK